MTNFRTVKAIIVAMVLSLVLHEAVIVILFPNSRRTGLFVSLVNSSFLEQILMTGK